jgi:hypothetical protein
MLCLRKVGHSGFFVYVHPVLRLLVAADAETQTGTPPVTRPDSPC